ncbi:MAG: hypothetical protein K2Q26_04255 [Bdellovibrionales bacterium]|nr:hypothetical protein [Bdellovibrionales bacterium]
MMRLLTTILLVVFGLSTAGAKVKDNYSAVKFNWEAFQKLSESDQLNYIKGYIQFFEEIEAANSKSGKKAALWETLLLIEEAYAADYFCFNGGIAYRTANQAACGTGAPPASAAPELFSCGANQARCSLVFGVGSNNKGFCYSTENNGRRTATRQCRIAAEAGGGPARIAQAVRRCGQPSPPANCAPLRRALDADTAQLASYCSEGHHKAMCQGMVARNNIINGRPARATTPATAQATPASSLDDRGSGCEDARMNAYGVGKNMDPVWNRLIRMAAASCDSKGRPSGEIMRTVGICTNRPARPTGNAACAAAQTAFENCLGVSQNLNQPEDPSNELYATKASELGGMGQKCHGQKVTLDMCTSRGAGSVAAAEEVTSQQIEGALNDQRGDLMRIVQKVERNTNLSAAETRQFEEFFGLNSSEFKSVFCASSPADFRTKMEAALSSRPANMNARRQRLENCFKETNFESRSERDSERRPRVTSNYSPKCESTRATSVNIDSFANEAGKYIAKDKQSGRCYNVEVLNGLPTNMRSDEIPNCSRQSGSVTTNNRFVRLNHGISGGPSSQPQYACLHDVVQGGKFELERAVCRTSDGEEIQNSPETERGVGR